ncbi:MAG: hypothetical protein ACFCD0_11345 [Gemmataceae bacterium]
MPKVPLTVIAILNVPLAIVFGFITQASAGGPKQKIPKWEYRVHTEKQVLALSKQDLTTGLNNLGNQGWELVAARPAFIFKRLKQEKSLADLNERVSEAEVRVERLKEDLTRSKKLVELGAESPAKVRELQLLEREARKSLLAAQKELDRFFSIQGAKQRLKNHPELKANIAKARAGVELKELDVQMLKEKSAWAERMVKKGYMSELQLQRTREAIQNAQKALAESQRNLARLLDSSKRTLQQNKKPKE